MEIRQLNSLVMIAKLGTFTKAAELLGYAPSTLTAQIQALEEELGTALFERFGRQIKLTKDGENLLGYAEQIIRLAEAAKACQTTPGPLTGIIRIGSPESLCLHCLSDILVDFRRQNPQVEVNLRFGTCCELHDLLAKNLVDLAFILDDTIRDSQIISHVLFDEPVLFLVAPRHSLAAKQRITPKDLDDQKMILTEVGCCYRDRFTTLAKSHSVKPSSIMEVSNVELIKKFTKDNLGIALLAKTTVEKELAAGELVALPWIGPALDVKAQIFYHREKHLFPALQTFLTLCLDRLKRG